MAAAKHPNKTTGRRGSPAFGLAFVKQCCNDGEVVDVISVLTGDRQHALFLTVCKNIDPSVNLYAVSELYPAGGKIGLGNSYLNEVFKFSKILRVHAAFHDAFGLMLRTFKVGPGYCYGLSIGLPECFVFGHVTGLVYWTTMFLFNRDLFDRIIV